MRWATATAWTSSSASTRACSASSTSRPASRQASPCPPRRAELHPLPYTRAETRRTQRRETMTQQLSLDPSLFSPDAIDAETAAFNEQLEALLATVEPTYKRQPAE